MPVLNSRGEPLMNAVNGPLSNAAREVLVTPAGLAAYLTDDAAVYSYNGGATAVLQAINPVTRQIAPVDSSGANDLVAGAGRWAAFFQGRYRDSFSRPAPQASWYPLAIDRTTGKVLVSQGYGAGLAWWDGQTLEVLTTAVLTGPLQGAADAGVAMSRINGVLTTFPAQGWPAFTQIINYTVADGWLVGWHSALNGLILWPVGPSPLGYLLSQGVDNFAADVSGQSGLVTVVSSSGAGQLPGELNTYLFDPVAKTVNGRPVTAIDLTAPAKAPLVVPAFPESAIGCVPFDRYDRNPQALRIVGPGESTAGRIAYVLLTAGRDPVGPAVAFASQVGARVLGYHDYPACDPAVVPHEAHDVGIQCYPIGGLEAAKVRIQESIDRVRAAKRSFALVPALYTGSSAWRPQDVLDLALWTWNRAAAYGVPVVPYGIIRPPRYTEFETALERMITSAIGVVTPPTPPQPEPPPAETDPDMPKIIIPDGPELQQAADTMVRTYNTRYPGGDASGVLREILTQCRLNPDNVDRPKTDVAAETTVELTREYALRIAAHNGDAKAAMAEMQPAITLAVRLRG